MNLSAHIERFLEHDCQSTTYVVVGLSGGVDSVVLLDLLTKSSLDNNKIIAVHVNHGLSELAEQWGQFCQQLCKNYGVDFKLEQVQLSSQSNIEAQARQARYLALANHVGNGDILVTAQHLDDQAETVLLALKRGAGVLGLAAMPSSLAFNQGLHNRPLLGASRHEIESYASHHNLQWIEDDSNLDNRFDRNYLRHQILPQLNQRWQGFSDNLARSASLLGQSIELLDELAAIDYAKALVENNQINPCQFNFGKFTNGGLSVSVIEPLSTARQNNLIRYWLRQHHLTMPSQAQLQQITGQMLAGALDSDPIVAISGVQIRRFQGVMMVVTPQPTIGEQIIAWQGESAVVLPNGLGTLKFSHHSLDESENHVCLIAPVKRQVEIRFSIVGSYKAWPIGRAKRRAVKKLWQEFGVPTWQRSQIPLVFFDDQLVAALGVWVEQGYQGCIKQPSLTISWNMPK